jgi:hypothetical protein
MLKTRAIPVMYARQTIAFTVKRNLYHYNIKNMERKIIKGLFVLIFYVFISMSSLAQVPSNTENKRAIEFPDIPGYKTLLCDFHQHTIFSDGQVWPTIRVKEAQKDGLDAMAITDHLEYLPHQEDIPFKDKNRPFQIASESAAEKGILIINGVEITRELPPGHANALFLTDANQLLGLDSLAVFRAAAKQGAFVIWNHPNWYAQTPTGVPVLSKFHKQLIKEKLIHAIEIVNEHSYSEEALKIAFDNKLTLMSGSDIHDLIEQQFKINSGGHRPVTLVFATEKSDTALKEALKKGRTVVWFDNTLIGKPDFLIPLIQQSLFIQKTHYLESYSGKSTVLSVDIENKSDADFILENQKNFLFYNQSDIITLKAKSVTTLEIRTMKELSMLTLKFKVLNAITISNTHPLISVNVYTAQN